jgi:protein ImuB
MRTLGECMALPRDGLARRFDQTLLDDIDRALGNLPDPRAPFIPPPRFVSRLVPTVPIPDVEALLFGVKRLIHECAGFLMGRQAGATRLLLKLEHEDYPITPVRIELSMPNRDAAHLTLLARERLSRITLPQAVEAFSLELEESMQLAPSNFSFFTAREATTENRIALVERLRARLGAEAVHGLTLVPAHRPELAFKETEPGTKNTTLPHAPRPLWLLATPRPLIKDDHGPRLDGPLQLLSGPERIESGWWDEHDAQRDYFVAANAEGARFWIYRDYDPVATVTQAQWFLHGVFA